MSQETNPIDHPKFVAEEYTTTRAMSNSFVLVDMGDAPDKLTPVRYDQFVAKLFSPDSRNMMLSHAAIGCVEEAGELAGVIKRIAHYRQTEETLHKEDGRTLRTHIIEELGDVRFYLQAVQMLFQITEQEVLQHNAYKLSKRYAGMVYSDKSAEDRADKPLGKVPGLDSGTDGKEFQ